MMEYSDEVKKELTERFKMEVSIFPHEVDPDSEEDWKSLTIGWAIAKGLNPTDARKFAIYIRYQTDLG